MNNHPGPTPGKEGKMELIKKELWTLSNDGKWIIECEHGNKISHIWECPLCAKEKITELKNSPLTEIAARWEAICDILEGEAPSDFMLSFPEVRQVAELVKTSK